MSDVHPDLPSLEWMLEHWSGMGTFNSFESMMLIEPGVGPMDFPGPSTYDYELYNIVNDYFFDGYGLPFGATLDGTLAGWVHPSLGFGTSSMFPPVIGYYNEESYTCTAVVAQSVPSERLNYIGFRYRPIGAPDWNYGWMSFSVTEYTNPNQSCVDQGSGEVLSLAEYTMRQIGVSMTPGDSIMVGLSSCPADLTGDGELDFFDVSAMVMNPFDFNGDTAFDFRDLASFLSSFSAGCP